MKNILLYTQTLFYNIVWKMIISPKFTVKSDFGLSKICGEIYHKSNTILTLDILNYRIDLM